MIRSMTKEEIPTCVELIRSSFLTVANEYGFTMENAPRFTAFATTVERLNWQFQEGRPMYVYMNDDNQIVGYYSLQLQDHQECELNNLCVKTEYRHRQIGKELFDHALSTAKENNCMKMNISIVEENTKIKKWYASLGATHIGTKKFDFFPFTCGYMEIKL